MPMPGWARGKGDAPRASARVGAEWRRGVAIPLRCRGAPAALDQRQSSIRAAAGAEHRTSRVAWPGLAAAPCSVRLAPQQRQSCTCTSIIESLSVAAKRLGACPLVLKREVHCASPPGLLRAPDASASSPECPAAVPAGLDSGGRQPQRNRAAMASVSPLLLRDALAKSSGQLLTSAAPLGAAPRLPPPAAAHRPPAVRPPPTAPAGGRAARSCGRSSPAAAARAGADPRRLGGCAGLCSSTAAGSRGSSRCQQEGWQGCRPAALCAGWQQGGRRPSQAACQARVCGSASSSGSSSQGGRASKGSRSRTRQAAHISRGCGSRSSTAVPGRQQPTQKLVAGFTGVVVPQPDGQLLRRSERCQAGLAG